MKVEKLFYNQLSFLENNYGFSFTIKTIGIDKKYIFENNGFEIGFFTRISQFDATCFFYYSINAKETILNIDDEFYKLFKRKSKKNHFWQLGVIIKEQLKEHRIFNYYVKNTENNSLS